MAPSAERRWAGAEGVSIRAPRARAVKRVWARMVVVGSLRDLDFCGYPLPLSICKLLRIMELVDLFLLNSSF